MAGKAPAFVFGVLGALIVTACAPTDLPPASPVSSDDASLFREPTLRDPLGYSSGPVDRAPYTTELDGQGLPGPSEMVGDDVR
ncbi:hypothetical protein JL101_017645 [Skermanella rosea]|uniref:hypothetical protein n=1 Tax=Skermanella rosea TaxID=1817965 RepID=UPI001931B493|nr:hypothetical protein [Skermanella rosea]UEM01820.1 hypothetical protein JL101_017645 [Skermanella rosea]